MVAVEMKTLLQMLDLTADVLPDTDWNAQISGIEKDQSLLNDDLTTMFNDNLDMGVQQMPSETSPSNQTWGPGSCPWTNIPSVC